VDSGAGREIDDPPGQKNSREKAQNAQNEKPEGQDEESSTVADVSVERESMLDPPVSSANFLRCIMSISLNLAGIFPERRHKGESFQRKDAKARRRRAAVAATKEFEQEQTEQTEKKQREGKTLSRMRNSCG
jgi:hypothetical protein